MNRRRFVIGSTAGLALFSAESAARGEPEPLPPFIDGQSVTLSGRAYALTDIIAPSPNALAGRPDPMADHARAVLERALREGAPAAAGAPMTDRWGRAVGPLAWRTRAGRLTTLQEILVSEGAARVAPESDDIAFIERCYAAERSARERPLGLWTRHAYRIRDAARAENASGFQIFAGIVTSAAARGRRVYFNFGADYRTDFTASVAASAFRRWKPAVDLAACVGRAVEVRGFVDWINGPSIDLLHAMQVRWA